uniref:Uncharacterized protein n=1 Tax=Anopheles coluzzii TaxID=1518534 RepID=A0A8W7PQW5_ANOCL
MFTVHYFFWLKYTKRVSIDVVHGICFCWCIIGMSGVFDSKSYATRWVTNVSSTIRSYLRPFWFSSWQSDWMNQEPFCVLRQESRSFRSLNTCTSKSRPLSEAVRFSQSTFVPARDRSCGTSKFSWLKMSASPRRLWFML